MSRSSCKKKIGRLIFNIDGCVKKYKKDCFFVVDDVNFFLGVIQFLVNENSCNFDIGFMSKIFFMIRLTLMGGM